MVQIVRILVLIGMISSLASSPANPGTAHAHRFRYPRLILRGGGGGEGGGSHSAKRPRTANEGSFKIYVFGGQSSSRQRSSTVESFELSSGGPGKRGWRLEKGMSRARAGCAAACLGGKVYVMGGNDNRAGQMDEELRVLMEKNASLPEDGGDFAILPTLDSVECYDPSTDTWTGGPDMLRRRSNFGACSVGGRLYVMGGFDGERLISSVESLDPKQGYWRRETPMPTPRSGFSCVPVGDDGDVWVIGGFDGQGASKRCDVFNARSGKWRKGPSMLSPRSGASCCLLDDKIYAIGGVGDSDYLSGFDFYCLKEGRWQRNVGDRMASPRTTAAAIACGGCIYVMGGFNTEGWLETVEVFEPAIGWSELRPMASPRALLAAAVV